MSNYSANVDMYRTTAGFIRRIFMGAQDQKSLGKSFFLGEIETISKLVRGEYEWGPKQTDYNDSGRINYSKYIMHILLFALQQMDANAILNEMSPRHKEMLTRAIVASQLCPRPRVSDAREENKQCAMKIKNGEFNTKTNAKNVMLCMRNIAECAEFVADEKIWNIAQEEMHKWSDLLGVPYDDSMIEKNDPIKKKRQDAEPQETPVQAQELVSPIVVQVESKEEPKPVRGRGRPKGSKNKPKTMTTGGGSVPGAVQKKGQPILRDILIAGGKTWWAISKLEQELKRLLPNLEILDYSDWEKAYIKKCPSDEKTIKSWFDEKYGKLYFNSENIGKLKALIVADIRNKSLGEDVPLLQAGAPVKPVVATPKPETDKLDEGRLITFKELARSLNRNAQSLRNKLSAYIKDVTEENKDNIKRLKSWFISSGRTPFGQFKSGYYSDFVDFLKSCDGRKKPRKGNPALKDKKSQDVPDNMITFEELRILLGEEASYAALRNRINRYIDNAPKEEQDEVISWFTKQRKSRLGLFNRDKIDGLKAFLDKYKGKKTQIAKRDVDLDTATAKNTDLTVEIESQKTSSDPVNRNTSLMIDGMTGVKGLKRMLDILERLYSKAQTNMTVAIEECDAVSIKVPNAETAAERSELLQQAMAADAKLEKNSRKRDGYDLVIKEARDLLQEREKLEALLQKIDSRIATFLTQVQEKLQAKGQ